MLAATSVFNVAKLMKPVPVRALPVKSTDAVLKSTIVHPVKSAIPVTIGEFIVRLAVNGLVSAEPFIVPATPSISTVESSATTLPVTSPTTLPVIVPVV